MLDEYPDSEFIQEGLNGFPEFSDGGCWFDGRNCCHHCVHERLGEGKPARWADEQYSMGVYAGRYCDECWEHSGYVKDGAEAFDPTYAGETYREEDC